MKKAFLSFHCILLILAASVVLATVSGCNERATGNADQTWDASRIAFPAAAVAGSWMLTIDTSEAARESVGADGSASVSISIQPSAPDGEPASNTSADAETIRYHLDIETDSIKITRCVARDLSSTEQSYTTTSCTLDKDGLIVILGSEENSGVIRNELVRHVEGGPFEGRAIMVAKALPMDVVVGRASMTPWVGAGLGRE